MIRYVICLIIHFIPVCHRFNSSELNRTYMWVSILIASRVGSNRDHDPANIVKQECILYCLSLNVRSVWYNFLLLIYLEIFFFFDKLLLTLLKQEKLFRTRRKSYYFVPDCACVFCLPHNMNLFLSHYLSFFIYENPCAVIYRWLLELKSITDFDRYIFCHLLDFLFFLFSSTENSEICSWQH